MSRFYGFYYIAHHLAEQQTHTPEQEKTANHEKNNDFGVLLMVAVIAVPIIIAASVLLAFSS